ncbi:hypothetical protein [Nitrosopumilus adriaticus]|uniref:Uncharacterized protein n=1 Tax=Nitrosopumilus adriaticus TaxID=1580092 RepID=A0A0D5C4F1_9ARCH|nr:hypothetical protein [Nitrosopumilus adriaticus]AJW71230.1 hypothetical protein NADRNF5_1549 [Nitrosopumilus adriaticus]
MSSKINFTSKWNYLVKIIFENHNVPDVLLMEELRFTPHTWKVWKSKFIERSRYSICKRKNYETKKEISFQVVYDKKQKMWKFEETSIIE